MKKLLSLLSLCTALFIISGTAAHAESFNKDQTKEIEAIFYDYLMDNPEVIFEAISKQRENDKSKDAEKFKAGLEKYNDEIFSKDAPFAGNPDGDVVIVEFFDYNCGYCRKALNDVVGLLKDDDQLKVIFKEMPVLSDQSLVAAQWSLAAQKQGKYFEFHKKLMNFSGAKSEAAFEKIAKDLDLDMKRLKKDAESKEIKTEVAKSVKLGRDLGVNGTPAFIIGDTLAPGYMGLDTMKQAIADLRSGVKPAK